MLTWDRGADVEGLPAEGNSALAEKSTKGGNGTGNVIWITWNPALAYKSKKRRNGAIAATVQRVSPVSGAVLLLRQRTPLLFIWLQSPVDIAMRYLWTAN